MEKFFENEKDPLFGRLTSKMLVRPFWISTLKEILNDFNSDYSHEDLLYFYLITRDVAKYCTLLMESGATTKDKIVEYVTRADSPFLTEGRDLLIS